ncbi:MAG: L,D-transpeptidase family protein [Minisyncoccia bacterium]
MKLLKADYEKRQLSSDGVSFFCVFGREGISDNKIEGDWKTPIGKFKIRKIYYRKDKIPKLETQIECIRISQDDAWCDDSSLPEYNSFVKLPFNGSYENLWREDNLYDVVVVIGYNDEPVIPNKGSAIFIHIMKEDMEYTKGCLAIKKENMMSLVKEIDTETEIEIY